MLLLLSLPLFIIITIVLVVVVASSVIHTRERNLSINSGRYAWLSGVEQDGLCHTLFSATLCRYVVY